jgi:hypothetical protein
VPKADSAHSRAIRAAGQGGSLAPGRVRTAQQAVNYALCGAKRRDGQLCRNYAGLGTEHLGIGKCKYHGGATIHSVKKAAGQELRSLLGRPLEISPYEALAMCIKIRAGEVVWLSEEMAKLDEKKWVEDTIVGKQFHLYARERAKAMQDLARYSHMAISLGIAERQVKLYEQYGETLARLIQGILGDLNLSADQRVRAPQVVRKHLILIDNEHPVLELTSAEQEAVEDSETERQNRKDARKYTAQAQAKSAGLDRPPAARTRKASA